MSERFNELEISSRPGYMKFRELLGRGFWAALRWVEYFRFKLGKTSLPPHFIKRQIVLEYAKKYRLSKFIETGTYLGEMLAAMLPYFKEVHSVELSEFYYAKARRRFASEKEINLHLGNSAFVLPKLLTNSGDGCLFWLDAHYSGGTTARAESDTPIVQELEAILADTSVDHVVLIDDAHCFDGTHGYPTIEEIGVLVLSYRPTYSVTVASGIIRVVPPVK